MPGWIVFITSGMLEASQSGLPDCGIAGIWHLPEKSSEPLDHIGSLGLAPDWVEFRTLGSASWLAGTHP